VALKVVNLEDVYVFAEPALQSCSLALRVLQQLVHRHRKRDVLSQLECREDDIEDIQRVRAACCWMHGAQVHGCVPLKAVLHLLSIECCQARQTCT
jgi:hypothetical protein